MTEAKKTWYISFYTAAGWALREQMTYRAANVTDGRLLEAARKKGKKLGANYFQVFQEIPRHFLIPSEDES
ncbi:MAG TPA: hypothetical protein VLC46_26740 [Thermoanaerobaculia bacterium]|jgi:hypothetical protein|nr:hypothetical protein [Thermoanaerobaculia bacterium]